jgi:hypothetical protein
MARYILVYGLRDPDDARPVALIAPGGGVRLNGTHDPELLWAIRDALAEETFVHDGASGRTWPGPATQRDQQSAGWAGAVVASLPGVGLRGRAVGYD